MTYPANWNLSNVGKPITGLIGKYKPKWGDEFNALSIGKDADTSHNWNAPGHAKLGTGTLALPGDPAFSIVDGTKLGMTVRNPNQPNGVDTNLIGTHGESNAYFSTSIKFSGAHGSHSGFWLLSDQLPGVGHAEIDFEAYGLAEPKLHLTVHLWKWDSSLNKNVDNKTPMLRVADGFQNAVHEYGVLVTPQLIIFAMDQIELARIQRCDDGRPYKPLLSNFTDPNRTDGYEPGTMLVNWMHIRTP